MRNLFSVDDIQKAKDFLKSLEVVGEDIILIDGVDHYKLTEEGKDFYSLSGLLIKHIVEMEELWEVV